MFYRFVDYTYRDKRTDEQRAYRNKITKENKVMRSKSNDALDLVTRLQVEEVMLYVLFHS